MIRDLVSSLDYTLCAEIALALFVSVFLAVCLKTIMTKRTMIEEMAMIPLEDGHREPSE